MNFFNRNEFAEGLKDFRSLFMFLQVAGWVYVEYLLVEYFMSVYNLYLVSGHVAELTFVVGLGIFNLVGLITLVFKEAAINLVLIFKNSINPKGEKGLIYFLHLYIGIALCLFFVMIVGYRIITYFYGQGAWSRDWTWAPFTTYSCIIIFGLIWGIWNEFKYPYRYIKVSDVLKNKS